MCDLITRDPTANSPATRKASLPETLPPPRAGDRSDLGLRIGDARLPSAAFLRALGRGFFGHEDVRWSERSQPVDHCRRLQDVLGDVQPGQRHDDAHREGSVGLCVPKDDYKRVDKVKDLIRVYERVICTKGGDTTRINGKLDADEISDLNAKAVCDWTVFRNIYERKFFADKTAKNIAGTLSLVPGVGTVGANESLLTIRPKIQAARKELKLEEVLVPDQITPDLMNALDDLKSRTAPKPAPKTEPQKP